MLSFKKFIEEKLSLEYHDELNPLLWKGFNLRNPVKRKLLELAGEWQKFAKIPDNVVTDIIFTGGNANFNYTNFSDIDVHIIIDKNSIFPDKEFLDDYLKDKKLLWSLIRKNKVKGYSVEFYAQDINETLIASSMFSLKHNKWIKKPVHGAYSFENEDLVKKVQDYKDMIDIFIKQDMDIEDFELIKEKLRLLRKESLDDGGEFSEGNLIFKVLRNDGYLDKINNYVNALKDRKLSL